MNITHKDLSVILSTAFMFACSMWYIKQVVRREVTAILAAWIVLGGTLSLSLVTYLTTPKPSLISNIGATVSMGSGVIILLVLLYLAWQRGEQVVFNNIQKACLGIAGVIATIWVVDVWVFKDNSLLPYIMAQTLMLIGYFLNVQKLWAKKKNTDSLILWTGICISSIFALDVATISGDIPAWWFSARGILCSGITVYIMCRIELRARLAIA